MLAVKRLPGQKDSRETPPTATTLGSESGIRERRPRARTHGKAKAIRQARGDRREGFHVGLRGLLATRPQDQRPVRSLPRNQGTRGGPEEEGIASSRRAAPRLGQGRRATLRRGTGQETGCQ